jgi:hypothetical protein
MNPIISTRAGDDFTTALVRFVDDSQAAGIEAIRTAAVSSLRRHLSPSSSSDLFRRPTSPADGMFNDDETITLARALTGPLAVTNLLGRSRIRQALADVLSGDDEVNVDVFDEPEPFSPYSPDELLKLLTPEGALAYFRRLIPIRLGDDLFGSLITGQAFTIAATTSTTLRRTVAKIIDRRIETGRQVRESGREIEEVLADAGISTRAGYGEMVYRTNMMESYRHGSWDQFQDPDIVDFFPAWQYSGIPDGRERMGPLPEKPDHHRWFGKFFARDVSFFRVRGLEARDVINCRCNFIGINKYKWKRLQKTGAVLVTQLP